LISDHGRRGGRGLPIPDQRIRQRLSEAGKEIEVPRAALTAGQIASAADFFSFGTNDLTQMVWAYSRDDAESGFIPDYLAQGILDASPFAALDAPGVGRLVALAATEGHRTRPTLKLGVCGEHGGDPASIHFVHETGLDYVSCSPFRVPVARLETALWGSEIRIWVVAEPVVGTKSMVGIMLGC
jgi:pyruvate,orthophosphate dikinase